jgi:hypothetical protein
MIEGALLNDYNNLLENASQYKFERPISETKEVLLLIQFGSSSKSLSPSSIK